MTKEERHLWYDFLRQYPVKFIRQKVVGNFILDFFCPQANLAVELDGSEHYTDEGIAYDNARSDFLSQFNIEVVRIFNTDIHHNFEGVCEFIDAKVNEKIKQ